MQVAHNRSFRRLRGGLFLVLSLALAAAASAAPADAQESIFGRSLIEMFEKGGICMWPILLCSVVGLAFVLERLVSLRSAVVMPPPVLEQVRALARQGKVEQAVAICKKDGSPLARLFGACLERADATGFEMEAALEEAGARVLHDLRRNARPLGVVADIAPLLGLMGTVLGMIKAFEVVAKAGALGRTELLATGIAEALLTTAFGLTVAIPAVVFYNYFRSKADDFVRTMEDACLELLTDLRKKRNGR